MSTIRVTNIEHGSTTDGGIQLDNAGHVTVDSVQMPTAGAFSNRNLIINGAMNVAQRGTSTTSTNAYGTVDRFKFVSSETNTQSQESLSTSDTPYSYGFRNYLRFKNTTASSGSASTYREIDYRVEAQDIASSGWDYTSTSSYITIQFWLRASVSQSYYLHVRSQDGTQRSFVSELAVTADTWKKFEIAMPGNSGITLDNDTGLGLLVRFIPWYGTTYTGSGTLDAWTTSDNEVIPDMTDTWGETTNATFDITGLQLEVGAKATPFEHRSYGDELVRCQRYCQTLGGDSYKQIAGAMRANTTTAKGALHLVTTMRAAPTGSTVGSGTFSFQSGDSSLSGDVNFSALWTGGTDHNAVWIDWAPNSGTFGGSSKDYGMIYCNNGATRKLILSAEL